MPKNQLPKKCRDRNQCYSKHNGRRFYHGVWGSPEAEQSYKRFIAALLESPAPTALALRVDGEEVCVSGLCDAFLQHHESRMYSTEFKHYVRAIEFLCELHGHIAVDKFSPKKLKECRNLVVKSGTHCREQINKLTKRLVRIFKWGVEEEHVKGATWQDLKAVSALRKGEEGTFDHSPRREVPEDVVRRTLPFMPPVLRAMVQIQYLTGMRPSEVFKMTVGSIDRNRNPELWYYVLDAHKTERFRVRFGNDSKSSTYPPPPSALVLPRENPLRLLFLTDRSGGAVVDTE